jgi:hypothetical protein
MKNEFLCGRGMWAQKNEVRILTEPAGDAQFGKSPGGWQNVPASNFGFCL